MTDLLRTGFHDATLRDLRCDGLDVCIDVEDIVCADEQFAARVTLRGVQKTLRNGEEISDLKMEDEDGEILRLEIRGNDANLTVQWNNFQRKRHFVTFYQFAATAIEISSKKVGRAS